MSSGFDSFGLLYSSTHLYACILANLLHILTELFGFLKHVDISEVWDCKDRPIKPKIPTAKCRQVPAAKLRNGEEFDVFVTFHGLLTSFPKLILVSNALTLHRHLVVIILV